MKHFDREAIDSIISFPALISALKSGFAASWTTPDRAHLTMSKDPEKYMLPMPSWTGPGGTEYAGIKVVASHPQNGELYDLPSIHGIYYLLDGKTGEPLATMDGTRMTVWRTAAASALASQYLSRSDSKVLTMVGTGALAPFMIRAHMAVRPIEQIHLWNHNIRKAHILAEQLQAEGLPVTSHPDLVTAVESSDIVSAATLSYTPLIFGKWVKPGTHVDTVGAFTPDRRETDDEFIKMARIYCDTKSGATREGGDLAMPLKDGVISMSDIIGDLHDLCRGEVVGRSDAEEITYFKSVGHASEDLAAAIAIWGIRSMTDQNDTPYASAVKEFAQRHITRLATPGHEVSHQAHPDLIDFFGEDVLELDVRPLLEGIDQGPYPTPYDEALLLAAQAWGARRTWFLTNGASKGNLVTCIALKTFHPINNEPGTVVVQRSMHSSVIDGLAMSGLDAEFVFPSLDEHLGIANGVTPQSLDEAIARANNPVAAYVVTPSYFGACADVPGLARVAHSHGIPLIVDEAWGAHFGFHPGYPINAIRLGADLAISSTHKLAGSLGQSAMLHLAEGPFADQLEPLLERAFRSMQSTSASSLLLASLDLARHSLVHQNPALISRSLEAISNIRADIKRRGRFEDVGPKLMTYPDVVGLDPMRISINTAIGGITGHEARSILLRDYGILAEMATHSTLVMLVGSGVVPYVAEVVQALHSLPNNYTVDNHALSLPRPGQRWMSIRDAYFAQTEVIPAEQSVGRVSADSVAAYPPGIPNLLPGELITFETVAFLQATIKQPFGHVRGGASADMSAFRVVAD